MSDSVSTYFITQWTENVEFLLQQEDSRFKMACDVRNHMGQSAVAVEQVGLANYSQVTGRAQPITYTNTPADRRWVYPATYNYADIVDNYDKLKMLIDPTSYYAREAVMTLSRAADDVWLAGYFGNNNTGQTASTVVPFASANIIAVTVGASSGNVGMNVPKLRAARKLLMGYENDLERDPAYTAMDAVQHDNMLNEAQAISLDFQDKPILVEGQITRFMGFRFIHSERLTNNGSGFRQCPAWVKSGVHFGVWGDIKTDIRQAAWLTSLPWQVYADETIGCTRTQENKCISILCNES